MDNQAPGLNFPLGSSISLTQLDVDNIEMLSGASSALYGSRGLNGTMIMSGKDPFKYQGLSVLVTQGANHLNNKTTMIPFLPPLIMIGPFVMQSRSMRNSPLKSTLNIPRQRTGLQMMPVTKTDQEVA